MDSFICDQCYEELPLDCYLFDIFGQRHTICAICLAEIGGDDDE